MNKFDKDYINSEEENNQSEIDLVQLLKVLWLNKFAIIVVTLIFVIIGIIFAFSQPKEYTSQVIFTSNSEKSSMANMGMLASLAGINMVQDSGEGIQPSLYPDVLESTTFIKELFNIPVADEENGIKTSYSDYLLNYTKKPWYKFKGFSSKKLELDPDHNIDNNRYISKLEMYLISTIKHSYSIDVDKKSNLIKFSVTTQSPEISAILADSITAALQNFVIDWKLKKAYNDLENSELLLNQATDKYEEASSNLADFMDKNKNVVSAQYARREKELQNEVDLTYAIYIQMSKQVQMDKIKIQDQKPVFAILQSSLIPLNASAPNKKLYVVAFAVFGLACSCIWFLRKDLINIFTQTD